jgi:hypothetical protein
MLKICEEQKVTHAELVAEIFWSVGNIASDNEQNISRLLDHKTLTDVID